MGKVTGPSLAGGCHPALISGRDERETTQLSPPYTRSVEAIKCRAATKQWHRELRQDPVPFLRQISSLREQGKPVP